MENEDELYEVVDLEADERFTELDTVVKGIVDEVFEGTLGISDGYDRFNTQSKEIFPLIAKDPVIGKKLIVDRAHTIMLLAILKKIGEIERNKK
jgi:hypothetical protein